MTACDGSRGIHRSQLETVEIVSIYPGFRNLNPAYTRCLAPVCATQVLDIVESWTYRGEAATMRGGEREQHNTQAIRTLSRTAMTKTNQA